MLSLDETFNKALHFKKKYFDREIQCTIGHIAKLIAGN